MSRASHTSHTHYDAHASRVSPCCTPHAAACATARLRANNVLHVTVAMGCQLPKSFFNRALKKCRSIDRCPHLRPTMAASLRPHSPPTLDAIYFGSAPVSFDAVAGETLPFVSSEWVEAISSLPTVLSRFSLEPSRNPDGKPQCYLTC
jgi:hypothetical protein